MADAPDRRRASSRAPRSLDDFNARDAARWEEMRKAHADRLPRPGESDDDFYARLVPGWKTDSEKLGPWRATRAAYESGALPERRGNIGKEERLARARYSGDFFDQLRAYLERVPGVWGLSQIVIGIVVLVIPLIAVVVGIFLFAWIFVMVRHAIAGP